MKKIKKHSLYTFCVFVLLTRSFIHAQSVAPNQGCESALPLCESTGDIYDFLGNRPGCRQPFFYYFYSDAPVTNAFSVSFLSPSGGTYTLYRLSSETQMSFNICNDIELGIATIEEHFSFSSPFNISIPQAGFYVVKITFNDCYVFSFGTIPSFVVQSLTFEMSTEARAHLSCLQEEPEFECKDCITSFSPTTGQYMVSSWVKESGATMNTTSYSNASIEVSFSGSASTFSLSPSGRIIDGWQRIEGVVDVPSGATDIHLSFETASGDAYFDDIRFYPLDGSMISYVYDPINLRLMAQLDERNYATFYEYDEEGKLIRVKKETERGVMTIQENRDNIIKK